MNGRRSLIISALIPLNPPKIKSNNYLFTNINQLFTVSYAHEKIIQSDNSHEQDLADVKGNIITHISEIKFEIVIQ